MKKIKEIGRMLLYPHWLILMALVIGCTAGLVYIFTKGLEESILAFCLYPVSAYTAGVGSFHLIKWGIAVNQKVREIPVLQPYFNDRETRKVVSMAQGMIVSLVFAIFKLTLGLIYSGTWEMAVGIYYLVLTLIRTNLMRVAHKGIRETEKERMKTEWINYLRTGMFMFFLNLTMSGMAIQMIWQNKVNNYPGFVIYVSAMHAFYSLINAFIQIFRFRKSGRPVFHSVNAVNLAGALMSMFVLQTGLLNEFGEPGLFSQLMNTITGTVVLASVFAIAVMMVVHGIKEVKKEGSYESGK